jgi:hypothetical protein
MEDATALKKMARFIMKYSYHAAQKTKLDKQVKTYQTEAYWSDSLKESENDFKGFADELTVSDLAWTVWHYVNSYDDWTRKVAARGLEDSNANEMTMPPLPALTPAKGNGKYKALTKWTSDGKKRRQPKPGSEGMKVYADLEKWFVNFKLHDNFVTVRKEVNRLAKIYHILPTYTDDMEPEEDDDGDGTIGATEDGEITEAPVVEAFFDNYPV